MKILSIRQPWAWLIVAGHKDIENRTWATNLRGEIYIHAGKYVPYESEVEEIESQFKIQLPRDFEVGGIVGCTTITDCVEAHSSRWFFGPFGFVLARSRPVRFHPCTGRLGFFTLLDLPENLHQSTPVNVPIVLQPKFL